MTKAIARDQEFARNLLANGIDPSALKATLGKNTHRGHDAGVGESTTLKGPVTVKLLQALTSDRHFIQAGFEALLPTI